MKLIVTTAFFVFLFFGVVGSAHAQDWNCVDPQAQQEMNYCSAIEFEEADRALNVAWNVVYPEIKRRDAEMPKDMQGWADNVLKAQRSWLDYRDAHCAAEGFHARGGSLEPLLVSGCKTHITQERTQDLLLLIETY